MDRFFIQKTCDRCGHSLDGGRIMSMYNTECICLECHRKEKLKEDYDLAVKADHEEIKKGNFNFEGIYSKKVGWVIKKYNMVNNRNKKGIIEGE